MYENKKLIRFIDFYPIYNTEGCFSIIPFRNEKDLLSENNLEFSYVQECDL